MKQFMISAFLIAFFVCTASIASSFNFLPVNFKPGMPSVHDDLKNSLIAPWDEYLKLLKIDASLLISIYPKYRFKIVGFTDSHECHERECIELSLRRATYVYKWLLDNGVPVDELDPPEGHGADTPLENNDSPYGRRRNRRVEINFIIQ